MKKFDLKKHLCILIGIILLISSTQTFSQEENVISSTVSQQEIEELYSMAKEITVKYNETSRNIAGTFINSDNLTTKNTNPYALEITIISSYKAYYDQINELADRVQKFQSKIKNTYGKYIEILPEGTYLQKVISNYINNRLNDLFQTQNHYLEKLLFLSDMIAKYQRGSRLKNEFLRNFTDNQTVYQRAFSEDMERLIIQLQRVENLFSKETIEFFSQKTHTTDEILRYFEARLPEKQKAILFTLKLSDNTSTIQNLIPHIRYYLKQTNRRLWKLDKFSKEHLATSISKMPFKERINFVDDLLDFSPQNKLAGNEIKQTEQNAGKEIVDISKIKLPGAFMAMGSFLIASTIKDVTADNNFYQGIGPVNFTQIKHKIDNGQILSLQEMYAYYSNERNTEEIIDNPIGLFEIFEIAITINDCLDILNVDKSPFNPAKQQKQVRKIFNKYLEKFNLENVISKVGTL